MRVRTGHLLDDLVWLEHSDPGGAPAGLSTNAYALLSGDEALVVDADADYLLSPLAELAAAGHKPVGLVLSHRHLVGDGDVLAAFRDAYGAPVLLHPLDASHPQALFAGVEFADPAASPLPRRFGLEVIHFPGQTEGSVMLYRERDGLLLAGDSAMGTTTPQAERGLRRFVRPPQDTSVDDARLREEWLGFERRPVRHLAPLHGTPQVGHPDGEELMGTLARAAPTVGMTGEART